MKYLRLVKVNENKTSAATTMRDTGARMTSFPKRKSPEVLAKGRNMEDAGNAKLVSRRLGKMASKQMARGDQAGAAASISVGQRAGGERKKALDALNTSFVPLTLPNIMEVDLTPNKPVGPMTRAALKNREAGTLSAAGAKSLENAKRSSAMAASQRGSKFSGERVRTNPKPRLKPSSGGIAPMDKTQGEGEGSTLAKQRQVGARQ